VTNCTPIHQQTTTKNSWMTTAGKRGATEDEHRDSGKDPHADDHKPSSVQ
ncbi:hypothetical protein A2U01_0097478, partial [Trifolium medium]|nr:hypothetical protein [Trifolium medium]